MGKVKIESETSEKKKSTLPPFDDIVDPNDSDVEENISSKSDVSSSYWLSSFPLFSDFISDSFVIKNGGRK